MPAANALQTQQTQALINTRTPHPSQGGTGGSKGCRRRPTLPRALARSTIGAIRLNDRVRDGNGCGPDALVASELRGPGRKIRRSRQFDKRKG